MANDLYSHNNTPTPNPNPRHAPLSSNYTSSRSLLTEPYIPPSLLTPSSAPYRYFPADRDLAAAYLTLPRRGAVDLIASKRSSEAFYEKSVLGSHNIMGHSEDWLSMNLLAKRPKYESTSNLSVYPQRPGEKHCAHYIQTRTCKFGDACKFDHPIWVPEGGNPNWTEIPQSAAQSLSFPERPGEPDCPYFLKTSNCKYGHNCKFNHPKDKVDSSVTSENIDASVLPERPSETPCPYYLKTGTCKFGANCKFHHPKDIPVQSIGSDPMMGEQYVPPKTDVTIKDVNPAQPPIAAPALHYNSKGLPIRLGEVDCPYYMKTGICNYGAACRFSHPNINPTNPAAMDHLVLTSPTINHGLVNPTASLLRSLDARLAPTMFGLGPVIYPQRPGEPECDHYMKTGECKFVERCKFHHPIDRSSPHGVKLTLAGLPRREGAEHCAFYMKTSTCKFGPQCKYDHPPPGEVIGLTAAQDTTTTSAGSVGKDDNKGKTNEDGQL